MAEVEHCGICGSGDLDSLLWLGATPLAEEMSTDAKYYPLSLLKCGNCGLVQLSHIVDPGKLFRKDHPYATGNTRALHQHYEGLAAKVGRVLETSGHPSPLVVDIGANDGTFLSKLPGQYRKLAVEPTDQVSKALAQGIPGTQAFWTRRLAQTIADDLGTAQVITASNVLAHVWDPHDFMAGVRLLLADGGTFITENHDVDQVLSGLQLDTVYHEHLRYYSLATLGRLLEMHGLTIARVENVPTHGGSFRVYARCSPGPNVFRRDAGEALGKLHDLVESLFANGSSVYGVSAATRATTLIHAAGLADYLGCVVEVPGSDKIDKVMPGTTIPVRPEERLLIEQPEYALLFCWHIADSVVPKLREAGYKGKFIVPLPEPRITDG